MSGNAGKPPSVGYRRPPLASRFVPGHSGNPKGRPKGAKNTMTVLHEALDERVTVTEQGKRRKVTKRKVMLVQLVNKAAAGDLKAIPIVLGHALGYEQLQATAAARHEQLSRADELGMAGIIARLQSIQLMPPEALEIQLEDPDGSPEVTP